MLVLLILRHEDSLFSKINYVGITDQATNLLKNVYGLIKEKEIDWMGFAPPKITRVSSAICLSC